MEDERSNAEGLVFDFINWEDTGVGLISEEEEVKQSVYSLLNLFVDWSREQAG